MLTEKPSKVVSRQHKYHIIVTNKNITISIVISSVTTEKSETIDSRFFLYKIMATITTTTSSLEITGTLFYP